jgi:hypothetical protein
VRRHLTSSEQRTLRRITRGLPRLRALRRIVEEIHRLFDRRCRTETALAKLARLRIEVGRCKGLAGRGPGRAGGGADDPQRPGGRSVASAWLWDGPLRVWPGSEPRRRRGMRWIGPRTLAARWDGT